jgi:hypothetical protein
MSGITITLRVIAGAATAADLLAARERFLAGRRIRFQSACAARTGAAARTRTPAAAQLAARREAVGRIVPDRLQQAADRAIARALATPSRSATRAARVAVETLEHAEEQTAMRQAEQELALARLLSTLPPGMVAGAQVERTCDGTLRARARHASGQIGIDLAPDGRALALDMANSGVHELRTPTGTVVGCEAEQALSQIMCDTWRRAGIEVTVSGPTAPVATATHGAQRRGAR